VRDGQQAAYEPLRQTGPLPADDQQHGRVEAIQSVQKERCLERLEIYGHGASISRKPYKLSAAKIDPRPDAAKIDPRPDAARFHDATALCIVSGI
jgi:hypothetical protein